MRTLLSITILTILSTGCGKSSPSSALLDDEAEFEELHFNLPYLEETMRKPLAARLETARWPFQETNTHGSGFFRHVVHTEGASWTPNAQETVAVKMDNFTQVSATDFNYTIVVTGPVTGEFTTRVTEGLIRPSVGYKIHGDMKLVAHGWIKITGYVDDQVLLSTRFTDLTAALENTRIEENTLDGLPGDVRNWFNQAIGNSINGWESRHRQKLLDDSNAALEDAERRGELNADVRDAFRIFAEAG